MESKRRNFGFGALAVVFASLMYFGLAATAFSANLLPPTNLTAETQAVNSGQIKLHWEKPAANDILGYYIYRNGTEIGYSIGADSRTYFDSNLSPSITYSYSVKTAYLGVPNANSPASNSASAVSPAYCSGGAAECVGLNPFVAGPGRTVVDLGGAKIAYGPGWTLTPVFTTSLPAGRYEVQVRSFDAYPSRRNVTQFHEQFFLSLLSDNREVARTGLTPDLQDRVTETGQTSVVSNNLVLDQSVNGVRGAHISVLGAEGAESANSVGTSAVMFTDINAADPGCLLGINKSADREAVALGQGLLYTITITNNGSANCTGVNVYDYLPLETEFVSETHNDSISRVSESEGPYYPGEHMLLLAATTPFTPGEVGVINLLVRVKANLPNGSCSAITDRAYAVGNEYSGGSVRVYSNSVTTRCDSEAEPAQIDTTVVSSPNPSYPGGTVTWTAQPFGSCLGPFEYAWTGDDGLVGNSVSVGHVYNSVGSYYATVRVSAPSCEPVTRRSPAPVRILPAPATLSVNCAVNPSSATVFVGEQVTVTAVPQGGTPPYVSYRWVGDVDTRNPTDQESHRAVYAAAGTKKLNIRVTDSNGQIGRCDRDAEITVKARKPSFEEI